LLSEHVLRHALEQIGVEAPVRFDEVTGSTNLTALRLAAEGAPEWTLVAAAHQTEGRGRLGREWRDEPGQALMFSLVLRPDLAPERAGLITLLSGACMATAARELGAPVRCKWPNDLMVGGKKAGGILAESVVAGDRFEHLVLGLGVNIGAPPADVTAAAALDVDEGELLMTFLRAFADGYRPAGASFSADVIERYRPFCDTLGRRVRAFTVDGSTIEGEAVDVDGTGALVVGTSDGLELVRSGEVEHLR
jgi:BirA family biotin operon repressor/biotin-[acetyl-CoA-carboxylase] ligase